MHAQPRSADSWGLKEGQQVDADEKKTELELQTSTQTEEGGRNVGRRGSSVVGQPLTMSGLTGMTHLPTARSSFMNVSHSLCPRTDILPMEAPLVSACTFYILYEASSVPSFISTLVNLRRSYQSVKHVEQNAACCQQNHWNSQKISSVHLCNALKGRYVISGHMLQKNIFHPLCNDTRDPRLFTVSHIINLAMSSKTYITPSGQTLTMGSVNHSKYNLIYYRTCCFNCNKWIQKLLK